MGHTSRKKDKETIEIMEGVEEEQDGESVGKESEAEGMALARDVPWAPEFHHYNGRLIHHADSASRNIGMAYGVLTLSPYTSEGCQACHREHQRSSGGAGAITSQCMFPYPLVFPYGKCRAFCNVFTIPISRLALGLWLSTTGTRNKARRFKS